jgi:hypothetical protein
VLDRCHRRPRRTIGRFERAGRRERIRIQSHGAARGLLDRGEVVCVVNPRDLLIRHPPRLFNVTTPLAELGGDDLHRLKTLDAFGVTRRGEMIGESR